MRSMLSLFFARWATIRSFCMLVLFFLYLVIAFGVGLGDLPQMLSTGIPELRSAKDIAYLQRVLVMDKTDDEAAEIFTKLIHESLNSLATRLNNMIHIMAHWSLSLLFSTDIKRCSNHVAQSHIVLFVHTSFLLFIVSICTIFISLLMNIMMIVIIRIPSIRMRTHLSLRTRDVVVRG